MERMPAEGFEPTPEQVRPREGLHGAVNRALEALPEVDTNEDPYARMIGQPIGFQRGRTYFRNGKIAFGSNEEVRRLEYEGYELMFAYDPVHERSEFIVHQFAPEGGLQSRTSYSQRKEQLPTKSFEANKGSYGFFARRDENYQRELDSEEVQQLEVLINLCVDGGATPDEIEPFIRTSQEEREYIEANRQYESQLEAEFQAGLDRIKEAERKGWENADRARF